MMKSIRLGYMSIARGEWESSFDEDDETKLDPNEIIIPKQEITIIYDYPLADEFLFTHHTTNPAGFTREALSKAIMDQYRQIYEEEDAEDGDPGLVPGMYNRAASHGKYGIWGHVIEDLILHTLHVHADGAYTLGLDS